MVDVVGVKQRVEKLVGEAQRQDVLHRLLTQVVVDAEDIGLGEDLVDHIIELLRGGLVVAEGLLDDHAAPAVFAAGHSGALQLVDHAGKVLWRNGEVEGPVPGRAALLVEPGGDSSELVESGVVGEVALDELDAFGEPVPDRVTPRGAGSRLHALQNLGFELRLAPRASPVAHQGEARGQQAAVGEVVNRGQQLLARQVTGNPEDHQAAGAGDAREALILRIAQRVVQVLL